MRWFLSQTFVKWLRQIRILGWVRFRIIRICYKIMWSDSPYNKWWDFILEWMGKTELWQKQIKVLDLGSTDSLLNYELQHRGYHVFGIDQRPYQEPNNNTLVVDILNPPEWFFMMSGKSGYDYIISLSTLEHIGLGSYNDNKNKYGDRIALENLHKVLKDNGYFLLFIPNEHLGSLNGKGYSYRELKSLIKGLFEIIYFKENNNQICSVLVKSND